MNPHQTNPETPPSAAAADPDPATRHYANFSEAVDAGRQAADEKARDAAPKLKQAVQDAAHDLAYGAAFGVCFAAFLVREITPVSIREGLRKGACAAREAVRKATAPVPAAAAQPPPAEPAPAC